MSMLFDKTIGTLGAGLTARRHTQSVVAGNIANADTPAYRARRVDFSEALRKVADADANNLSRTHGAHVRGDELSGGPMAAATSLDEAPGRVDGNNVVLEEQISLHVANALEFQAVASLTRKKFALMRYAIDHNAR